MLFTTLSAINGTPLVQQSDIVTMLSVTIVFFLVLLVLGISKSYKLRAENKKLTEQSGLSSTDDNKVYKDFTEGHLYDNY